MRNKYFILGTILALTVLIVVIALLFLFGNRQQDESVVNPFPDTTAENPFAPIQTNTDPYSALSNAWHTAPKSTMNQNVPLLRLISRGPAIGPIAYQADTNEAYVRFTLRQGGLSYETPLARITDPQKVSEREILRVADVRWSPNGMSQLVRYTNDVHEEVFGFLGTFGGGARDAETPPASFTGNPLPNNIVTASFSPKSDSVFYVTHMGERGAKGYVESVTSRNRVEAWSTPFRGITAHWGAPDSIVVYNNPSLVAHGAVWTIHPKTFSATPLLGGELGLAARMNTTGTHLLYSLFDSVASVYSLRVLDVKTNVINYLPLPTIAEKCVWAVANPLHVYCAIPRNMNVKGYLDHWQTGTLLSDDVIWRFDAVTGLAKLVIDPKEYTNTTFDIIDLSIDQSDSYLAFRTKRDEMVWAVQLQKEQAQE